MMYPFLLKPFLDGGCQWPQFHSVAAATLLQLSIEVGSREGFGALPKTLRRRMHLRLVGPMPQAGQGHREADPKRGHVPPPRFDPPHASAVTPSE